MTRKKPTEMTDYLFKNAVLESRFTACKNARTDLFNLKLFEKMARKLGNLSK